MAVVLVGRECKFVTHIPAIEGIREDVHMVKEVLHYSDKSTKHNVRMIKNFNRPFWLTKPHYRNHNEKKESEVMSRLDRYSSTDSDLARNIASRLGGVYAGKNKYRDVVRSPYVYGSDISGCAIIKHMYMEKYPEYISDYSVCTLDIETDLISDEITILSIATDDKLYTIITEPYLKKGHIEINHDSLDAKLTKIFDNNMPDSDIKANRKREIIIVKNELQLVLKAFKICHELKPDFVAIWNIDFEMTKFLGVLEKYRLDPKEVFSDPDLPTAYRSFNYKKGAETKVTASGKRKPKGPEERWNVVEAPASFIMIDAMVIYHYIRISDKTPPNGFGLESILTLNLGADMAKLKFPDDTDFKGIDWHYHMQANKPLEYIVYNMRDVTSMLDLDAKTQDLKIVIGLLSNVSEFHKFASGPKRIVDALHFFYLENKQVIASFSRGYDEETDKLLGLKDWIVLLPSFRINPKKGLKIISEDGSKNTNVRAHVTDLDCESSYPSDGMAANISKDTTRREVIRVTGVSPEIFKKQNINIMFGRVNAIEYCESMLNAPSLFDLLNFAKVNQKE